MDVNIVKKPSKSLVIPTGNTTDHNDLKFFSETILLLKVDCYQEFYN